MEREPVVDIVVVPQGFEHYVPPWRILKGLNEEMNESAVKEFIQNFRTCFHLVTPDVGRCNMTCIELVTGNHPPIKQYPRRLPLYR
ncbi:hypothetical protein AVEN_176731-1 [Araneus ventricosus]|uniref:Uncharacterized protein n=1 Tax=Araneus ventricosus TaxID=182803 RepID=A0A4Y2SMR2_ARAVE|nr:hypothetical protein AVEN_176731-1 [Araneus ventricosus]